MKAGIQGELRQRAPTAPGDLGFLIRVAARRIDELEADKALLVDQLAIAATTQRQHDGEIRRLRLLLAQVTTERAQALHELAAFKRVREK